MASPASVVACSTCGALYTPSPGDGRVCQACRVTVADDPSARPLPPPTPLFDTEEPAVRGSGRSGRSTSRPMRRPRSLKRAVVGLFSLALLATGATVAYTHRETLEKSWSSLRHRPAETWTSIRRRSGEAWLALRRLSPIESLRPDPGATAEASAAGLGDNSTGTHRRSHNKRKRRSADGR